MSPRRGARTVPTVRGRRRELGRVVANSRGPVSAPSSRPGGRQALAGCVRECGVKCAGRSETQGFPGHRASRSGFLGLVGNRKESAREATERVARSDLLRRAGVGPAEFLRVALEGLLQGLMEAEVDAPMGADRYERTADRATYRHGHPDRDGGTRGLCRGAERVEGVLDRFPAGPDGTGPLRGATGHQPRAPWLGGADSHRVPRGPVAAVSGARAPQSVAACAETSAGHGGGRDPDDVRATDPRGGLNRTGEGGGGWHPRFPQVADARRDMAADLLAFMQFRRSTGGRSIRPIRWSG